MILPISRRRPWSGNSKEKMKISNQVALTFDDVLLLPGFADFSRADIDIATHLTKTIKLQIPFVSAPMDRVTEAKMAIALGKLGGIGIIHRNLTIKEQVAEIVKVKKENLVVGAAISAQPGFEPRVAALVKARVDALLIDSAHGFAKFIIEATQAIKKKYPKLPIIAGNIATYDGAKALIQAGADALRVGMGPGSICSTRIISGMGVPQITAIRETVRAASSKKIPIIADGGVRFSGDVAKALAAGASSVMMGSYFGSAVESPGKVIKVQSEHVPLRFKSIWNNQKTYLFKEYRGMGSVGAMEQGAKIKSEDEFHGHDYKTKGPLIAEGVEGLVPVKGTVAELVEQMVGGLKSGMYYVGAKNIHELWKKAEFIQITPASLTESHPHDILMTNPGKNYVS